ncbi:hypothetical protein RAZWK3B_07854 [Roseobacter sp. AzwK-3b]|uniref:CIA30 family protein n=1 Tax=Roseobacter sp. AzwK-3b TaxID=351016 RepID=UPI000156A1AC|nr:CIA30 family protein [Roseobacter sp. AzwK-3b]EDM69708.1 hypothetical protein RAZWK3B_07854 [Roseobacter sp. AzwK-3b]
MPFRPLIALFTGLFLGLPANANPVSDYTPPPVTEWRYISDQVMGGVSHGGARAESLEGETYLRLIGDVSIKNNGGFIQARAELEQGFPAEAQGVVLQVRGNGERYYVFLRTRGTILPWQFYNAPFQTSDDWQTVRLPFTAFKPSGRMLRATPLPETVTSLGVVAYGRNHRADVTARWIGLY